MVDGKTFWTKKAVNLRRAAFSLHSFKVLMPSERCEHVFAQRAELSLTVCPRPPTLLDLSTETKQDKTTLRLVGLLNHPPKINTLIHEMNIITLESAQMQQNLAVMFNSYFGLCSTLLVGTLPVCYWSSIKREKSFDLRQQCNFPVISWV